MNEVTIQNSCWFPSVQILTCSSAIQINFCLRLFVNSSQRVYYTAGTWLCSDACQRHFLHFCGFEVWHKLWIAQSTHRFMRKIHLTLLITDYKPEQVSRNNIKSSSFKRQVWLNDARTSVAHRSWGPELQKLVYTHKNCLSPKSGFDSLILISSLDFPSAFILVWVLVGQNNWRCHTLFRTVLWTF